MNAYKLFFAIFVALLVCSPSVYAQARRAPANAAAIGANVAQGAIKIRDLTSLNSVETEAPGFARSSGKKQKWGVMSAEFDIVAPEIPELNVTYYVFCDKMREVKPNEKRFSLMSVTSSYPNLFQGKERKVGVVLSPNSYKKVGRVIGFAAVFSIGDNVVAQKSVEEGLLAKYPRWWEDPRVVDTANNKNLEKPDELLKERSKTVFGYVDIDNYEESK